MKECRCEFRLLNAQGVGCTVKGIKAFLFYWRRSEPTEWNIIDVLAAQEITVHQLENHDCSKLKIDGICFLTARDKPLSASDWCDLMMKEKMEAKRKCEVYMAGLEQLSDHLEQQKKLEEQVQQQRAAFDVTRMAKRFYKKKYMEELRKK